MPNILLRRLDNTRVVVVTENVNTYEDASDGTTIRFSGGREVTVKQSLEDIEAALKQAGDIIWFME